MATRPATHPSADTLKAFGLGKLDAASAEALMRHLDQCPQCCRVVSAQSGDDFLAGLRQAHDRNATLAPARSSSSTVGGANTPAQGVKSLTTLPGTSRAPGDPALSACAPPAGRSLIPGLVPELADHPQYEVLRELGRGGMGVVYLARHRLSARQEVLKVMNREYLLRPGSRERFLREIQAASRLSHPNVVEMYTALEIGDLLVLVMEYVEGHELARVVKSVGPLPVVNACFYVQQAALGLQHAHEKGMVHRDIKPQNLILARNGKRHVVKILDFGLAKATCESGQDRGLTGEGRMLGTPDYIAPEQTLDAAKADIRADIYSLGCTLYFLLTGSPPFHGKSLYEVLHAHQSIEARPLNAVRADVSEALAVVVQKMMCKDPGQRHQKPAEIVQALSPFVRPADRGEGAATLVPAGRPSPARTTMVGTSGWHEVPRDSGDRAGAADSPAASERGSPFEDLTRPARVAPSRGPAPVRDRSRVARGVLAACLSALLLGGTLLGLSATGVLKLRTPDGVLVLEDLPKDAEVTVDGRKVTVTWDGAGKTAEVTIPPGKRHVEVRWHGSRIIGEEVAIEEGGRRVLRARVEQLADAVKPRARELAGNPGRASEIRDGADGSVKPQDKPKAGVEGNPSSGRGTSDGDGATAGTPGDSAAKPEPPKPVPEDDEGFVPLFNGKDKMGWRTHPDHRPFDQPVEWRVDREALVSVTPGRIYTDRADYKDFELRAEVLLEAGAVGAMQFRSDMQPQGADRTYAVVLHARSDDPQTLAKAFQLQRSLTPGSLIARTGGFQPARALCDAKEITLAPNRWYRMELIANGWRFIVKIDGKAVADVTDTAEAYRQGRIALQRSNTVIENIHFRNLRLKEWKRLFNGKDLTGWRAVNSHAINWSVEDGVVVGRGKGPEGGANFGHLVTDAADFANFHLRAELMLSEPQSAALRFRVGSGDDLTSIVASGYGVHIQGTEQRRTDAVQLQVGTLRKPGVYAMADTVLGRPKPIVCEPGKWLTLEVVAVANRFRVTINGREVVDCEDPENSFRAGRIGLVCRPVSVVRFRKIEIMELPPTKTQARPAGGGALEPRLVPSTPKADSPSVSDALGGGWKLLFNGKDLKGWKREGRWTVSADGTLVGKGPNATLVTTRDDYGDFTVRAELSASADVEAFLLARVRRRPNLSWKGMSAGVFGNGTTVQAGMADEAFIKNERGMRRLEFKPGEGFTLEVRVGGVDVNPSRRDEVIWVTTNGQFTAGCGCRVDRAGAIGLFVAKGTLRVKRLAIQAASK